eukprot:g454.t1
MASVDKLSIRGIRAFSPEKETVIKFFKPLTVIVGKNGCGKTTIIECLKYSTTGSLPPGSASGQSFVHDPQMADLTEVKACLKLRFNNRAGNPVTCIRSLQLKQLKKSLRFKALDAVLQSRDAKTNEKVSLSHRCSEVDTLVPELLGVSKAVLDNVIFCHQEESNWPLKEGSDLKKRFDDIFESSRYTKALKAIREEQKKQKNDLREHECQLKIISSNLKQANRLKEEKEECIEEDIDLKKRKKTLEGALASDDEQLKFLYKERQTIQKIMQTKETWEDRLRAATAEEYAARKDRDDAPDNCDIDIDENISVAELEKRANEMKEQHKSTWQNLQNLKSKDTALRRKLSDYKRSKDKLLEKRGQLNAEIEFEKEQQDTLKYRMSQAASKYKIDKVAEPSRFLSLLKNYEDSIKKNLENQRNERKKNDLKELAKVNTLTAALASSEGKENSLAKEIEQLEKRKEELFNDERKLHQEAKLGSVDNSPSKLGGSLRGSQALVATQLARVLEELERAQSNESTQDTSSKVTELKQKQLEAGKKANALTYDLKNIEQELKALESHGTELARIEAERGQVKKMEGEIKRLLSRASDVKELLGVDELNPDTLEDDLKLLESKLEESLKEKRNAFNKIQSSLAAAQSQVKEKESLLEEQTRKRRSLESEMRDGMEKLRRAGGSTWDDLPSCIAAKKKSIEECNTKIWQMNSIPKTLKFLKEKALESEICPLCVRPFSNHSEHKALESAIKDLLTELESGGNEMDMNAKKKDLEQDLKELEPLVPARRRLMDHQNRLEKTQNDLNTWREKENEYNAQRVKARDEVEDADASKKRCESKCRDAAVIWNLNLSLSDARAQLKTLEDSESMNDRDKNRSIEIVQSERDEKFAERERLQKLKETLGEKIQKLLQESHEAQRKVLALKKQKSDLETAKRKSESLQKERNAITERISEARIELKEVRHETRACKKKVDEAERQYKRWKASSDEQDQREREQVDGITLHVKELQQTHDRLTNGDQKKRAKALLDCEEKVKQSEISIRDVNKKLSKVASEITTLEKVRDSEGEVEASFARYRRVIIAQEKVSSIKEEIQTCKSKLNGMKSIRDITLRLQKCESNREKSMKSIAKIEGQMVELRRRKKACEDKLRSKEFKDVEDQHRKCFIDFNTVKMCVEDLDKYHRALDKALMTYHTMKIKKINSNIREIWAMTYKGQDIDSIEIRSDVESKKVGRSFNYRIVMLKGETELHMRGRCSAGQKVLASLVIRLALAEAFCVNCGILALDEPTTNLDDANKIGLAEALCEIIKHRSEQKNFQLVVITHDQEFVRMIGENQEVMGGSRPEGYYVVERTPSVTRPGKFFSSIFKSHW